MENKSDKRLMIWEPRSEAERSPKSPWNGPSQRRCCRAPTRSSSQGNPSPISARYKLRILEQADGCESGEVGALLRREGLYWSNLQTWRRQRAEGTLQAFDPSKTRAQVEARSILWMLKSSNYKLRSEAATQAREGRNHAGYPKKSLASIGNLSGEQQRERRRELMDEALHFSETHGVRVGSQALGCHRQASIGKNDGGNSRRLKLDLGRHPHER